MVLPANSPLLQPADVHYDPQLCLKSIHASFWLSLWKMILYILQQDPPLPRAWLSSEGHTDIWGHICTVRLWCAMLLKWGKLERPASSLPRKVFIHTYICRSFHWGNKIFQVSQIWCGSWFLLYQEMSYIWRPRCTRGMQETSIAPKGHKAKESGV